MPLEALLAVTVALTTIAPFGSLITPLRSAVAEPCAIAAIEKRTIAHITAVSFISLIVMASAFELFLGFTVLGAGLRTWGTQASTEMNGRFLQHPNNQSNKIRDLAWPEGQQNQQKMNGVQIWESGDFDAGGFARIRPQSPRHARSIVRDTVAALRIYHDHPTVPVQP